MTMTRDEIAADLAYQEAVSDLADQYVDEALARGEAFSEALTNWAISKAEREIPRQ